LQKKIITDCLPSYPGGHLQGYDPISSKQIPPFWQGSSLHSSILYWHKSPVIIQTYHA